jgi:hypothetical protein
MGAEALVRRGDHILVRLRGKDRNDHKNIILSLLRYQAASF